MCVCVCKTIHVYLSVVEVYFSIFLSVVTVTPFISTRHNDQNKFMHVCAHFFKRVCVCACVHGYMSIYAHFYNNVCVCVCACMATHVCV